MTLPHVEAREEGEEVGCQGGMVPRYYPWAMMIEVCQRPRVDSPSYPRALVKS